MNSKENLAWSKHTCIICGYTITELMFLFFLSCDETKVQIISNDGTSFHSLLIVL